MATNKLDFFNNYCSNKSEYVSYKLTNNGWFLAKLKFIISNAFLKL